MTGISRQFNIYSFSEISGVVNTGDVLAVAYIEHDLPTANVYAQRSIWSLTKWAL